MQVEAQVRRGTVPRRLHAKLLGLAHGVVACFLVFRHDVMLLRVARLRGIVWLVVHLGVRVAYEVAPVERYLLVGRGLGDSIACTGAFRHVEL